MQFLTICKKYCRSILIEYHITVDVLVYFQNPCSFDTLILRRRFGNEWGFCKGSLQKWLYRADLLIFDLNLYFLSSLLIIQICIIFNIY